MKKRKSVLGPIALAKKNSELPKIGTPLRTKKSITKKEDCAGWFVSAVFLDGRRSGESGEFAGYFPGTGGDVWAVKHPDGTVAAYAFTEVSDEK